ncbi:unnamed protein product, partial [Didymodactylos carnosus]
MIIPKMIHSVTNVIEKSEHKMKKRECVVGNVSRFELTDAFLTELLSSNGNCKSKLDFCDSQLYDRLCSKLLLTTPYEKQYLGRIWKLDHDKIQSDVMEQFYKQMLNKYV